MCAMSAAECCGAGTKRDGGPGGLERGEHLTCPRYAPPWRAAQDSFHRRAGLAAAVGEPGPVKKKLLGIPAGGTEMLPRKIPDFERRDIPATGKILLPQRALDPDIDGESPMPLPTKEQGAGGDFFAHTVQLAQCGESIGIGHGIDALEIDSALCDIPCRAV